MRLFSLHSGRALPLFVGAWVLVNCGSASAGYLPVGFGESRATLFTSDNDSFGSADSDQTSSFGAAAHEVQLDPVDFPDQPDSPNARHNPWSSFVSIFVTRGHRSGNGAGRPNSGNDSGGQSMDCLLGRTGSPSAELKSTLRDFANHAIPSTTSRLFRPPRF